MLETSTFARRAGSRAGRLPLVGGAAALDFANTASGRGGGHALEHLQVPGDLAAWAAHAALLDGRGLAALEDLPAPAAASLLVQALGLREAVHRAVSAVAAGRPAGEADLAVLAEAHRRGLAAAGLRPSSVGYRWQWDARSDPAEALLGRLGLPVNFAAVLYGGLMVVNLSWPRAEIFDPTGEFPILRWAAPLTVLAVIVVGIACLPRGKAHPKPVTIGA